VKPGNDNLPDPPAALRSTDGKKSAIVTVKRRPGRFGDVPDMTLEEHRRRGEAATELWREMMRRTIAKP
jgi:hypothetical protein